MDARDDGGVGAAVEQQPVGAEVGAQHVESLRMDARGDADALEAVAQRGVDRAPVGRLARRDGELRLERRVGLDRDERQAHARAAVAAVAPAGAVSGRALAGTPLRVEVRACASEHHE